MDNKLKDTIYYLLVKFSSLEDQYNTKKKLAKLLYFIDFYNFKEHGETIATSKYKALRMGPVPSNFYEELANMVKEGLLRLDKVQFSGSKGRKYMYDIYRPDKEWETTLNSEEIAQIDKVFEKFKYNTALSLEELSHLQAPWNSVDENEDIPIETAHLLQDFDSL